MRILSWLAGIVVVVALAVGATSVARAHWNPTHALTAAKPAAASLHEVDANDPPRRETRPTPEPTPTPEPPAAVAEAPAAALSPPPARPAAPPPPPGPPPAPEPPCRGEKSAGRRSAATTCPSGAASASAGCRRRFDAAGSYQSGPGRQRPWSVDLEPVPLQRRCQQRESHGCPGLHLPRQWTER